MENLRSSSGQDDSTRELVQEYLDALQREGRLVGVLESAARRGQLSSAPPPSPPPPGALAGDILYGADAIAEFLFGDKAHRRKVYNLIETDRLPHFRLGATICARKSVLLNWIAEQEAE